MSQELKLHETQPQATAAPAASAQEDREATDYEIQSLKHVIDKKLPRVVWIALIISGIERVTFWAVTTPWQNYIQNRPDGTAVSGALGLGQSTATNISNAFSLFYSLVPIPFAIVSDMWLGRYNTLCISAGLYLCGCLVQFVTSLPAVLSKDGGVPGLALSMFLIGLGLGGVRSTVSPFTGDQYPVSPPRVTTNTKGEEVIIDRTLTLQYIYNVSYWLLNIAALSILPSTYLEKACGFWASNLLAFGAFWVIPVLLFVYRKDFVKSPVQGNVLVDATRVLILATRHKFKLNSAKPQYQREYHNREVSWSDEFVTEVQVGLLACRVMAWFCLFYLGINQMSNNLISQAGQMRLAGIPNDAIQIINPIACIILGPIIQHVLFPTLARYNVAFGPIARMGTALLFMSGTMAYAAITQRLIYNQGPCYENPLFCPAAQTDDSKAGRPNDIDVWVQIPVYVLMAISEILGFATLSEYSYSKAPRHLKTVVQAMRQITAAFAYALGMAVSPLSRNPTVLWLYVGMAVGLLLSGLVFWTCMGHHDKVDEQLNKVNLGEGAGRGELVATKAGDQVP